MCSVKNILIFFEGVGVMGYGLWVVGAYGDTPWVMGVGFVGAYGNTHWGVLCGICCVREGMVVIIWEFQKKIGFLQ